MALSHKSIHFKNKKGKPVNNERLEFLGDAILDAIVGDIVYKHFPGKREGFLTNTRSKLVQRETLNKIAQEIGLSRLIYSSGRNFSHNSYMAGNAFEALIGALYLDRGYNLCMRFMQEKILTQSFTFEDFLSQLEQVKKLGSIKDILGMIPGMGKMKNMNLDAVDEKQFVYIEAIIKSMTIEERQNPDIINVPRRKRIAQGSGRPISEVHKLIKQFEEMRKMMKQFGGLMNDKSKRKGLGRMFGGKLPF